MTICSIVHSGPTPTDWDKDFVDLEWQAPKEDGGAP